MVTKAGPAKVEFLILGAGWTSGFLIPLLKERNISYAATTTTGHDNTYTFKFTYDEKTESLSDETREQLAFLPTARTVLITFPLKGENQSSLLHKHYVNSHGKDASSHNFIQLGSTGIWDGAGPNDGYWYDRTSPYNKTNTRAIAEDELLDLGGCVLNLAGLWGGERQVIHWIDRVASTKELLASKKSLHMIHGADVASGIVAVHGDFSSARGKRFMLTDTIVYDWWALILGFAGELDVKNGNDDRAKTQLKWLEELMLEHGVRALPRGMKELGRCYDSLDFWRSFKLMPSRARL